MKRFILIVLLFAAILTLSACTKNPFRTSDPTGVQYGLLGNRSDRTVVITVPNKDDYNKVDEWRFNPGEERTIGLRQGMNTAKVDWMTATGRTPLWSGQFEVNGRIDDAIISGSTYPWYYLWGAGSHP